jgi:Zn-dependent peptidase ImmA (M78 family)
MNYKEKFGELYEVAKNKFSIQQPPKVFLRQNQENAEKIFGQTAYYDPDKSHIVVFITNRHPKDILRSYCHELIHHVQNERGDLVKGDISSPTYAQDDDHMREMEKEAYLEGNLLLRDFEDNFKYESKK